MLIMSDEELQGLVVQPQTYAPAKRAAAISSLAYEVQQYRLQYAQVVAAYQASQASYNQMQAVYQQLIDRVTSLEQTVRRNGSGMGRYAPTRYIERTVEVPRHVFVPMPPPPAPPPRIEPPQASRFTETPVRPISVVKVR